MSRYSFKLSACSVASADTDIVIFAYFNVTTSCLICQDIAALLQECMHFTHYAEQHGESRWREVAQLCRKVMKRKRWSCCSLPQEEVYLINSVWCLKSTEGILFFYYFHMYLGCSQFPWNFWHSWHYWLTVIPIPLQDESFPACFS